MRNDSLQPLSDDFRFAMANMLAQRIHVAVDKKKLFAPNPQGAYFIAVPGPDRAICVFHPLGITDVEHVLSDGFQVYLSERLDRRVEVSVGAYLYVQVSYKPQRLALRLPDHVALDLTQRPSGRLMVPVAVTKRGPLWLSLLDMDAVIIGGTRRFGKTTFLHGWILALATGESSDRVKLYLYDGKDGLEFSRYADLRHVGAFAETGEDLARMLGDLRLELAERSRLMNEHKVREIGNLPSAVRPPYIVLVVDELAEALKTNGVAEALADLISRGGAYDPTATRWPGFSSATVPRVSRCLYLRMLIPALSLDGVGRRRLPRGTVVSCSSGAAAWSRRRPSTCQFRRSRISSLACALVRLPWNRRCR
jgi:hypothetical protein